MIQRFLHFFGVGLPPSTGVREALQWLMMARLTVLYPVLGVVVLFQIFQGEKESHLWVAYGLLAVGFAFNLLSALTIGRLTQQGWWLAALHIVFDALLTSTWIWFSGSKDGLFALFYLIQILFCALILYQKGAVLAATVSTVLFGAVTWVTPMPERFLTWSVYAALFLLLGIIGGYLSEELLRTTERLKEKSHKIEKLVSLHERILRDLPTGLLTVDGSMRVNFVNPTAEQMLGKKAEDIVGRPLAEVEPELLPFFSQIDAVALGSEAGETAYEHHRSFFVSRPSVGAARLQQTVEVGHTPHRRVLRGDVADLDPLAGLGSLLDVEAAGGRVLLFQDVTRLVHLEEKLKQHEKLAAVGQLAAGIAHEIRNPLASMSASIEMLKGSIPSDALEAENRKLMEIALREIDRLNRLVSEFLDFVKPEKFKKDPVDLKALLAELALVVRQSPEFKQGMTLKEEISEAVADGHVGKLRQVVLNLLMNALQAMKRPGTVTLGCADGPGERVRFWVEDQGVGMTDEVLSHLYEPFFTTKDRGTGLGLATVYKIVEAHGGEIQVSTRVGQGSRFEIWLPKAS